MTGSHYPGQELDLFAHARNWKGYWSSTIRAYLTGDVLEVGAGLGTNTEFLKSPLSSSWTCLEPDPDLAQSMRERFHMHPLLKDCRVEAGTTETWNSGCRYDAILYIDVLEHIDADRQELARASAWLRPGGRIIVLSPAHQWLYAPFDRSIGHVRRYDKASLAACTPPGCEIERLVYLDSAGMLTSMGNRLFLRQSMPTLKQILFWDRVLVPVSVRLDRLTRHTVGKSVLGVWQNREARADARR
jgi:SAM-dependent methyltransferase